MTLEDILKGLVGETSDVTVRGSEYTRNGTLFAAHPDPNIVELRLGNEIAEAAMRTADTASSPRGEDWVRLSAKDWSSARDRLEAWFRVAWRLADRR